MKYVRTCDFISSAQTTHFLPCIKQKKPSSFRVKLLYSLLSKKKAINLPYKNHFGFNIVQSKSFFRHAHY